jgi:hypothetical protein
LDTSDLSGLWLLAEPSDQIPGSPGQNSKNFFLYKTQPHCVGLVRIVDLLSISLGLKTAVLAEPSDQKSVRPGQNSFLNKTLIRLAKKKKFPVKFCVFRPTLKPNINLTKALFKKVVLTKCFKLSQDFESFIRSPFV